MIDTRGHMLKPDWLPAIGGWHCDAIPRGDDGQPELDHPAINSIRHYLCVIDCGTGSLTEFIRPNTMADKFLPKVASPGKNLWGEHSELINEVLKNASDVGLDPEFYVTTCESWSNLRVRTPGLPPCDPGHRPRLALLLPGLGQHALQWSAQ